MCMPNALAACSADNLVQQLVSALQACEEMADGMKDALAGVFRHRKCGQYFSFQQTTDAIPTHIFAA